MNEPQTSAMLQQAAGAVPVGPAPVTELLRAGRRARRRRQALAHLAVAAGVVLVVGGSVAALEQAQPDGRSEEMVADAGGRETPESALDQGATADSVPAAPEQSGPLVTGGSENCAIVYTPEAVRERDFAFDGVVVGIGPPVSVAPGPPALLDEVGVTFAVQEWFHGGSGATVTVDIPVRPTSAQPLEGVQSYDVGTRLLVSGVSRSGTAPLDAPFATTCGFTRYYDEATAAAWR